MFIYIIKNKIAFYDDAEDYTAKKLYKKLLKEYGCEPVIIKLEPDENNEFAVTAEITPAQVLHLMAQTIYAQENKPVAMKSRQPATMNAASAKKAKYPPHTSSTTKKNLQISSIRKQKAKTFPMPETKQSLPIPMVPTT